MKLARRCSSIAGLIGAATILSGGRALPASYSDSFTADPATLSCGYYGSVELCGGATLFSGGARFLNAGDTLTESVSYTSLLVVPGSKTFDMAFIGLFQTGAPHGPALPGPNVSTVKSTLAGYSGPAAPILGPYMDGYLYGYVAAAGFCCGYGTPNPGFSANGMSSHFTILASDPTSIAGLAYGFQATLPATPKVLSAFPGGTIGHPAILPKGPLVGAISSDISGPDADSQFYTFIWNGGLLQTKGTIDGANPLATFDFQLYQVVGTTLTELKDLPLSSSNGFSNLMSIDLAKGNYEIGMYTDSPYDPQFSIAFNTPVGNVPEPATWSLMVGGLLALGGSLRARRSAEAVRA